MKEIIGALLAVSLLFSWLNAITAMRPCETYGYYLPATFLLCNLNEKMNKSRFDK